MPQAPSAFYDHDAFAPSGEDGTGTARAIARSQTAPLRTLRDLLSGEATPAQVLDRRARALDTAGQGTKGPKTPANG